MDLELVSTVALASGAAWASGINLYAAVLMLGILGTTGSLELPPDLQMLSHPVVIAAAGFMYCVEFFADKTPGVDSAWDALHTFVRIPAGAVLAAAAVGELDPSIQLAALLLGGGIAASTHAAKAGSRAVINTSPEPVTNWTASVGEDVLVLSGLWAALNHPLIFLALLAVFLLVLAWFLTRLYRVLKAIFGRIAAFFRSGKAVEPVSTATATLPALEERSS